MPVCGPGTIVDVENRIVFIVREQLDMVATIGRQSAQVIQVATVAMSASEEIPVPNAINVTPAARVPVDKVFGRVDGFRFQELHHKLRNFVQRDIDNRIVSEHRRKPLAVEKNPLQYGVGKNNIFG